MLDNIFIASSVLNTSKKGQVPNLTNCFGNNIILLHIDPKATNDYGVTYGYTAVYQDWQVTTYHEDDAGLRGGDFIRPSAAMKDVIACKAAGAILKDVI